MTLSLAEQLYLIAFDPEPGKATASPREALPYALAGAVVIRERNRVKRLEPVDIVGNMDEEEAAKLAAGARIHTVVPMHHDMSAVNPGQPERLVDAVRSRYPGSAVLVPARGAEFVYTRVRG